MAIQVPFDFGRKKLVAVALSPGLAAFLARFPRGLLVRGLGLGFLSIPLFALPVIAALAVLGGSDMASQRYVALKAALAAVQGGIITPFIVLAALGDVVARQKPAG
jgi:choline-glycine betaine transporter